MKTMGRVVGIAACVLLVALELSGCGSPPPPKSAKKELSEATAAMEEGESRMRRTEYDEARNEFEKAIEAIKKGYDTGNDAEVSRLKNMMPDAISRKNVADMNARKKAAIAATKPKPATTAGTGTVAQADPDAEKRAAEKAKEAEQAKANDGALKALNAPKPAKKVDEPEDVGDVAANKAAKAKKEGDAAEAKPAEPKAKDDPTGVFPNVTSESPVFQIIKMQRVGKFVVAFCQVYNKTEDGKRITVGNFFKDRDNQEMIRPLTTVSFPYEHFSLKVKDLIADQSVRNLTPNSEEVPGLKYLNFVSVGECPTEEAAGRVAKVYIKVAFSDGTSADATSAAPSLPAEKVVPSLKIK